MQADTEQRKGRDSVWSAPFVILMAVNFFQSMAAFMANATLPVFADSLGATASMVGVVVSSFTLSALLVRPFAGPAFDSFSRKRLLLIAQGIICLSFFAYGFVDSLGVLIAIRLFHGVGIGCSGPLAMSLVSEYLPAAKFASGISIYALAQSFAQVIGPATGLYLVGAVGFSAAYFLAAALLVVAMGGMSFYDYQVSKVLPRWAVGVGVNFKLFDGLNREYKYSAAKQTVRRVGALQNKAGKDISVLVEKLYNQMMNYRNQMTSIDASLAFAEEYLRMKNAAFLEGMSSSTDLIDAELNLAGVRTERLQAAYNFDLLLAQLLEAAGISDEFSAYARRADARPILFDKK